MLFNCTYCTSPVAPGRTVCNRPLCRERDTEHVTKMLGLEHPPPVRRITHDVGPP